MKQTSSIAPALLLLGLTTVAPLPASSAQSGGWTTLLDGSSMNGFTPLGDANWRAAEGAVQADSGTGFLVSQMPYDDFEMRVEFWASPDANSGVFLRCQNPRDVGATTCYEVNIYDQRPDQLYRTAAIVNVAEPTAKIDAGNRWNTFEITARGPQLMVRLNGTQTVNTEDKQFARGPVALQYSAGTVKFRNVQIRQIR